MRRLWPNSLAGALYRRVVALVAITGILMGMLVFLTARQQIDQSSDAQLITATNVLYALMQEELSRQASPSGRRSVTMEIDDSLLSAEDAKAFHASADWRMFAVFENNRPMLRSDIGAPIALVPRMPGFHNFHAAGAFWRSYGLAVPKHNLLLVVAERMRARDIVIKRIGTGIILPFLLLILTSSLFLWIALRNGLAQLRLLSAELSARSLQDLMRFAPERWPRDLTILITALNRLFDRVDRAFEHEQNFTDDAAHQLRTPLAAIKLQAQMLARTDRTRNSEQLDDLLLSIERAVRLVDRMLTLARLESTVAARVAIDLRQEIAAGIAEQAMLAARVGVEFFLTPGPPVPLASDPDLIRLVLSALLDNAVNHAPPGTAVEVAIVADEPAGILVTIADHGPGIPAFARETALRRFSRLSQHGGGSGLGLAIVARAIKVLGGQLDLADRVEGSGLIVHVTLPR